MNKILLVIQREYFTRIQKKSFWIASLLGPLLITAIYAVPIWLAMQDKEVKRVEILDESGLFQTKVQVLGIESITSFLPVKILVIQCLFIMRAVSYRERGAA